ncbi:MAG: Flp pilus assembly protein CpaB [Armatimonadetes bacterium]|nr:Flp pilus assembly protein CpaB [Armatimonadota bacterium]
MMQGLRRVNPVLIVGFMLALVAGLATYRYVRHQRTPSGKLPVKPPIPEGSAILASRAIVSGEVVTVDMLKSDDSNHPEWTEKQRGLLQSTVGRVTLRDIASGEEVSPEDVEVPLVVSPGTGYPFHIPEGLRALSIQTGSALSGQPELAHPGDQVDVIALTNEAGQAFSRTIAQNAPVLSVIDGLAPPSTPVAAKRGEGTKPAEAPSAPSGPPTVVIGVTPEQAEQIALAQMVGSIRVTIRNRLDESRFASKGTDGRGVLWPSRREKIDRPATTARRPSIVPFGPPPATGWPGRAATRPQPSSVPKEPRETVEVIRGNERTFVEVRKK